MLVVFYCLKDNAKIVLSAETEELCFEKQLIIRHFDEIRWKKS